MAISIRENIITLHTKKTTYQMMVDSYGFLLHLYYGRKTDDVMDYLLMHLDRGFSGNPYDTLTDRTYSLDVLPQEFPCRGNGDYRSPAIDIRKEDGTFQCDLRYKSAKITKGKYSIPGLPAVYADQEKADTVVILLEDKQLQLEVALYYGVLEENDIITRSVKVTNHGEHCLYVEKLLSASLDFMTGQYDAITFYGRHAMERNMQRKAVSHGSYQITSRRGTSSHQYNPTMILADRNATEDYGSCYAMTYVYSGGFLGEIEMDQFNQTRMQIGLAQEQFSYPLAKKESLWGPEVLLTYSSAGFTPMSHQLHRCIREHICRGEYKNVVRPILVNSWEASYFDISKESIVRLAKSAAELGVEMLVMDDGWFGKRDDDNSGLGDWYCNEKKIGCSLHSLIDAVNAEGLKFGIWIEPEMVNEDSDLYRKHPDWALTIPGKDPVRSRNQLVLDFSREEVVDEIFRLICKVIDQGNIEYIKWDMNRSIAEIYNHARSDQGKVLYDYILGLYRFLEQLNQRYPHILIEGCSGGGGRFDAGMMHYTPQIWCSDNTDAIDRTIIQYGTSFAYPVSVVGSHVSAVPNHQTHRITPLKTRGVVAMAGTFGYELDFSELSQEEREEIKQQIKQYQTYAELITQGDYYRLSNPMTDPVAAWAMISKEKEQVLVNVVILENHGNSHPVYLKLRGLAPNTMYKDVNTGQKYSSDVLMEVGLPIIPKMEEYQTEQYYLKKQ